METIARVRDFARSRLWQSLWIVFVIGAGLLWRSSLLNLPAPLAKYGGSALWALLVFLLCGWIWPRMATVRLVLIAIAIAYAVEWSQLYHAPCIDQIRKTRLGALTLGSVFNWPDFPAYTLGILLGALTERVCGSSLGLARGETVSKG